MVLEYRDARDAYEQEAERVSIGYATELEEYKRDHPGPTFKGWLRGIAGRNRDPDAA